MQKTRSCGAGQKVSVRSRKLGSNLSGWNRKMKARSFWMGDEKAKSFCVVDEKATSFCLGYKEKTRSFLRSF